MRKAPELKFRAVLPRARADLALLPTHPEFLVVKCTHCTLSSADYCTRMIARWCDTIILYGSKEVLGYAGVLNVDCENNQGSPEQSP